MEKSEAVDVFVAAQRGLLSHVQKHLDSQDFNIDLRDKDSCTALHWAAWNNHLSIVKLLVDRGATIDMYGGDLWSTPFHWAVRAGHINIVTYLYKKSADPLLKDNQGYNSLHLAVHGGHSMVLSFLLAHDIDVDVADSMGRTGLMWAAYKGNSMESLNVLIKWNADLNKTDLTGFTALHWAVVSGNLDFARALLAAGCNSELKDPSGKTALDWANERNYGDSLTTNENDELELQGTPFVTAIPQVTILLIAIEYVFVILPNTWYLWLENIMFWVFFWSTTYTFYKVVVDDPGYIRPLDIEEAKPVIIKLSENGKLDSRHFCISCNTQKPIRSKHCRFCNRCVSRYDHHCPWTHNCIGAKNQFYFVIFLISFFCGTIIYNHLSYKYITIHISYPTTLKEKLYQRNIYTPPYVITLCLWLTFNAFWSAFVFLIQLYQISVGITTNESVNFRRLEYLVHPDDLGKSTNDFDNDGDGEDDDEEKLETLKEAVLEPLSPDTKSGTVTVPSSVAPMYKRRLVNPFNQGLLENWRVFCLEGIYETHGEEGMIEWDKLESVPKRLLKSERYLKRIGRWRSERSPVEGSGWWMSIARLFRRDGEKSINDIV
ncbi:Palmitoyltransferase zdhhc13 [Nowakowskiella sp. JEL0407]|nr:Palmitoyltransferase zdhhc13 [Nowakowskiella sp. JEL0407]